MGAGREEGRDLERELGGSVSGGGVQLVVCGSGGGGDWSSVEVEVGATGLLWEWRWGRLVVCGSGGGDDWSSVGVDVGALGPATPDSIFPSIFPSRLAVTELVAVLFL